MEIIKILIYTSISINAILFTLLFLIIIKTYAIEELFQSLKRGVILVIDEKSRRKIVPAKIIQEGFCKTKKDGIFRISHNSLKFTDKGFLIGFAHKGQVVSSEVALATQKAEEEKIPELETKIIEIDGKKYEIKSLEQQTFEQEKEKKFFYDGIIVSFDAVTKYISGLNNYLLEALVQREVISALRKKYGINTKALLIILIIILIIIIAYVIITKLKTGQINPQALNPAQIIIPTPQNATLTG